MAKTETRRINIWINGKEVQNNIKDITASYKKLIAEQAHMTIGTKEYMAHATKIKQLKGVIDDHKRQIGSIATAWQKAKDTIVATGFGVLGGNMLTALTTRIGGFFTNIITGATKTADQFADIRKTTGMTMEEVEALSGSLSKIDTRTSTSDLREMAIVAGQLGIAKDDVLGFVDAVDKTAVALGDEFTGGADEVAATVGKLRNVFGDIKTDDVGSDIMHISNALNELGAAGFATSPVVADFANRIGGVGITLGLTSGQVLGLSATLQELNVSTERGGTAVVKILQKMTTETDKFAVIAGMSVTDFKNLVNTDLYGAFTKVMEGSKRSGSSATALAGIIKDLEIQGAGASEVFAKLGGNVAMMNEKVDLASTSLLNTDSVMKEFALKNDNLAGQWEKAKKTLNGIVMGIGKELAPAILSVVKGFVTFLEWIKRNADALKMFFRVVIIGTTALIAYNVASKISLVIKKMLKKATVEETAATIKNTIAKRIAAAATYLYTAAIALLSGNLKKASIAMRAFSIVTRMNPIGLLVGVVTAVVGALVIFNKETDRTTRIQKDATKAIAQEKAELANLTNELMKTNPGTEERARLIGVINEKYGEYLPQLLNETMSNAELATALYSVNQQLERKVLLQMKDSLNNESMEKKLEIEMERVRLEEKLAAVRERLIKGEYNNIGQRTSDITLRTNLTNKVAELIEEENKYQAEIEETNAIIAKMMGDNMGGTLPPWVQMQVDYMNKVKSAMGGQAGGDVPETPLSTEGAEKQKKLESEYLKIYEQLQKKIQEINDKGEEERLDGEQKELQESRNKFEELYQININARAEIEKLGNKATKKDIEAYALLKQQYVELTDLSLQEETQIREKWEKQNKEDRKKALEDLAETEKKILAELSPEKVKQADEIRAKYTALREEAEKYNKAMSDLGVTDNLIDVSQIIAKMTDELKALKDDDGKKDFLGMTKADWEKFKKNFDEIENLMRKLGEVANDINTIITNGEAKRMQQIEANYNKEMEKVETMYAQKHLSESAYNDRKKKLDSEFEAQKLANERRQAKRKKDIATFEAILDTANAIAEALPNVPLSILMGVLGGIQIAAIRSEPLPQLYTGGFTAKSSNNMQPAGTVHANEWVSPQWMVDSPVTGPIISQLEAIRNSGNARRSVSVPQSQRNMAQQGGADISSRKLDVLISQNGKLLQYLSDPDNRRGYFVYDSLKRYEGDLMNLQKLRKIS